MKTDGTLKKFQSEHFIDDDDNDDDDGNDDEEVTKVNNSRQ